MGTTFYHGRRVTTTDTGYAIVGSTYQRFYIPSNLGTQMIAYAMGFLGGRWYESANTKTRLGVGTAGSTPADLLAYTVEMTVSNPMSYGGDGEPLTANLTAPILLNSGKYSLGATSRGGDLAVAMRQASEISEANENFFTKSGLSSTVPTDPIGGTQEYNGHLDIWVIGVTNTPPKTPTGLSPSGQVLGSDTTPNLTSNFDDAEEVLPNGVAWDYVNQVNIQLRRKSDGALFWDTTYTASSSERSAKSTTRTYAGTALVPGTDYEWRVRHSDRAGAWSGYSAWTTFNINPGGSIGTPSSPTGKQLTVTPGPFVATWSHVGGLSANAAQVQLYESGSLIDTSPLITVSVADGNNISIPWASCSFANLTPGGSYSFKIRGRDTASAYSPYSASRSFTVNAVPNTPSGLSPTNSQAVTQLPKLTFTASDPDNTTSTLVGSVEITLANATVLTRTATYNATSKKFEYQITSSDVTSYQTLKFRARVSDGTYWSGYSSQATFIYGAGPVVDIVAPTEGQVFAVSSPTVSWTATGQVKRQVRVFRASDDVMVHESSNTTTAGTIYVIPSAILRHGEAYYVTVDVTNSAPLTGTSQAVGFSVNIPEPELIQGFAAYPSAIGVDATPTAIELNWEATNYPSYQFLGYDIYRKSLSMTSTGLGPTVEGDEEIRLRRLTSPLQTSFTDYHPRADVTYEYTIRQVLQFDLDVLESQSASAQANVTIEGITLASAVNPSIYRADLRYLYPGSDVTMPLKIDQRQVVRIGARRGRTIRSSFQSWEPSGRFIIASDSRATAEERITYLREAVLNGRTFSYRDYKGRKLWVTIIGYSETDRKDRYEVDIQFREEDFTEGEPV